MSDRVQSLYRGYSLGAWYVAKAYSIIQMKELLIRQALKAVGKYKFTEFEKYNTEKKRWEKITV